MKKIPFLIAMLAIALFAIGCSNDENEDIVTTVTLEVSDEPCDYTTYFGYDGTNPLPGMSIREEGSEWKSYSQTGILGFTYKPGTWYLLKVKKTILANPPMDASNITYELIEILEEKQKQVEYKYDYIAEVYKEVENADGSVTHDIQQLNEYDSEWRLIHSERVIQSYYRQIADMVYEGNKGTIYLTNISTDPLESAISGASSHTELDTVLVTYTDATCKYVLTQEQKQTKTKYVKTYDEDNRVTLSEHFLYDRIIDYTEYTYTGNTVTEVFHNPADNVINTYVRTYADESYLMPIEEKLYMNDRYTSTIQYTYEGNLRVRELHLWSDGSEDYRIEYKWNGLICECTTIKDGRVYYKYFVRYAR